MKHFGIFNTSGEVETAISQSAITEPYVVMVSGDVFYNSVGAETGMTGCWVEDSQGNIYSGELSNDVYFIDYNKPSGATWTLYYNGQVVTAQTYIIDVWDRCGEDAHSRDHDEQYDFPVEDIDLGTDGPSDESYSRLNITYNLGNHEVSGDIDIYYCNPDPCGYYEEGTQEKCECEGKYWWGDECHDEPEPEPSESDPCSDYEEGSQEKCECDGRYWYGDECHDEPEASE